MLIRRLLAGSRVPALALLSVLVAALTFLPKNRVRPAMPVKSPAQIPHTLFAAGVLSLAFLTLLVAVLALPAKNSRQPIVAVALQRSTESPTVPAPVGTSTLQENQVPTGMPTAPDPAITASAEIQGPAPSAAFLTRPVLPASTYAVPQKPGADAEGWQLTFADEFDSPSLDSSKWNTSFWWGRTRAEELQYYTDESVEVTDGVLKLKADNGEREGYSYISGIVTTQGKFSQAYGYFEVRSRIPPGKGLWSAVWLLPEAGNRTIWPPEIDVAEFMGGRPQWAFMNYHYRTPSNPHGQASKDYQGPDFAGDFHTFGLEWAPTALTWYIDGVQRHQVRQNIPALPMYVIANLAIGDWAGVPDESTPFPSRFLIDHIRVWRSSSG